MLTRWFHIYCVQLAYIRISTLIFDLEFNIKATDCKTQPDLATQGNGTNNYTYKIS